MSSLSRFESILSGLPGGDAVQIRHLQKNTRTAELAAHALGVEVGAIVKSILVFADEQPYIALVAGDRRASLSALASLLKKHEVRVARAAEVKKTTGFAIGGVPPLALNADNTLYPVVMDLPHGAVTVGATQLGPGS